MVILDGAHNPSGSRVLFDFLQPQLHDCPGRKLIVILGMMQDKDHAEYLRIILPLVDTLILTQPHINRASTIEELRQVVPPGEVKIFAIADAWESYCQAQRQADPCDLICITGSLFLVGEILQHLASVPSPLDKL
jgi:dihydrofolate synthase/folylpolyglutamate synthase